MSASAPLPDDFPGLRPDGRQSPAALAIQRGVRRMLAAMDCASLCEFTLRSGRRADVIALARDGCVSIVEIKSSVRDFRADRKWPDYRDFCDRLYFAVDASTPLDILPPETGLILADGYGAEILREPPHHPLAPARRKALTLRFARAAAAGLHAATDPEARGFLGGLSEG
ncbi:MmcB family DNA repair protein [Salinarimonas sp.]|uniref:MmcB family DNA repair protein n=1 Tax=Salinarimonas sp. TaxID=2766526 RepID=UPI00391A2B4C